MANEIRIRTSVEIIQDNDVTVQGISYSHKGFDGNADSRSWGGSYTMNQAACNSPHFVFWVGKKNLKLQNKFWSLLNKIVKKNFLFDDIHVVDKYSNLFDNIIKHNIIKFIKIIIDYGYN